MVTTYNISWLSLVLATACLITKYTSKVHLFREKRGHLHVCPQLVLESSALVEYNWPFCIDASSLLSLFAGTVIDNQVCHPHNYDFYMCAHAGMIVSVFFPFPIISMFHNFDVDAFLQNISFSEIVHIRVGYEKKQHVNGDNTFLKDSSFSLPSLF